MKITNSIVPVFIWGPIFIIPTITILLLAYTMQKKDSNYHSSLHVLEDNIIEKNKKRVSERVNNTSNLISYEKSFIKKELHKRIQQRVDDAKKIAINLYNQHHKTLEEKQLKRVIIDAIRPLVWNGGESFIWILDYKGVFYLAPEYLRHLEGTSIINFKDATGREVIKEEIKLVKSKGSGFLWDTFTKPNGKKDKQYKQLAYVTDFGHFNWYLGSSEYLDTATKATDALLLEKISTISTQHNEHIFIINRDGNILLHPSNPKLQGENILSSVHPHMTRIASIFKAGLSEKINRFIQYPWPHPVSKELNLKTTYVKDIEGTDWIIGSGFFAGDIEKLVDTEKEKIVLQHEEYHQDTLTLGSLLIIIAFILSVFISRWLKTLFKLYETTIQEHNSKLKELNEHLEAKVKRRTIRLENANAKLERLVTIDALTKIHNRYYFMERIEAEIKRFHRYKNVFSLIMFDLDYFKQVNDNYGHQKGDEILISISQLVQGSLRDTDILFRFGGEEFMILLPQTELEEAYDIADRTRKMVEEKQFGLDTATTISIGVVEFQEGDSVDSIVSKADTLLYQSKDKGRNSISKMPKE